MTKGGRCRDGVVARHHDQTPLTRGKESKGILNLNAFWNDFTSLPTTWAPCLWHGTICTIFFYLCNVSVVSSKALYEIIVRHSSVLEHLACHPLDNNASLQQYGKSLNFLWASHATFPWLKLIPCFFRKHDQQLASGTHQICQHHSTLSFIVWGSRHFGHLGPFRQ